MDTWTGPHAERNRREPAHEPPGRRGLDELERERHGNHVPLLWSTGRKIMVRKRHLPTPAAVAAEQPISRTSGEKSAAVVLSGATDFAMMWSTRALAFLSVVMMGFIFVFVLGRAWPVIRESGLELWIAADFDAQITAAYNAPAETPVFRFGLFGLLAGTLTSTLLALVIAVPVGIGSAALLSEFAPAWMREPAITVVRLLASIPSIVFGLVGLATIVPFVESRFITVDMQIAYLDRFQMTGRNLLSSVIVLACMIVPMIVALSMDAIRSVPDSLREVGCSIGMTPWRVVWRIVLPSAKSGILAGIILAAGRGIGEAIAVSMVCGGIGMVPNPAYGAGFFLGPVLTLASAIINKSEAISVASIESALFACGAVLLAIGAVLSIVSRQVERFFRRKEGLDV